MPLLLRFSYNGLLRQFIPKKTDFRVITNQMIDKYQNLINNRPRKILQFETPIEVFNKPQNVALRS
jgi:IS30 family transposase